MYKGYKSKLFYKDNTNNSVGGLLYINKCSKCNKLNKWLHSPALNNIQMCLYCGNPYYIIKS